MGTDFAPIFAFVREHEGAAKRTARLAVAHPEGCTHLTLYLRGTGDGQYIRLMAKTALWLFGGCALLTEDERVFRCLREAYCPGGARAFDRDFMSGIYRRPFSVELCRELPPERRPRRTLSAQGRGCRVGIDLGGSDRKAAAVIDGKTVYTEEVVWQPKSHADPRYHYEHITSALRSAAAHLPRVDAVGFSTAGVVIGGEIRRSSLFMAVPAADFDGNILRRAAREVFGDIPCAVCNDGDVAALAGSVLLGKKNLLGIAMGTSQAAGYIDSAGQITGRLNELAFAPVDLRPDAPVDPWSQDRGVGERYFSQEGVIRLAGQAGLAPKGETPAEKLLWVQNLAQRGDERALWVFSELGRLLGQTLPWYRRLMGCENVLLLGRVISGVGGEALARSCREELERSGEEIQLLLPDGSFRRIGQAAAAALLENL